MCTHPLHYRCKLRGHVVSLQDPTDLQAELARKIAAKRGAIEESVEGSGLFGEDEEVTEAAPQPQAEKKKKKKKKTEKAKGPKDEGNGTCYLMLCTVCVFVCVL